MDGSQRIDVYNRLDVSSSPGGNKSLVSASAASAKRQRQRLAHELPWQLRRRRRRQRSVTTTAAATKLDLTKEVETTSFVFNNLFDEKSNNIILYEKAVQRLIPGKFARKRED
jgi:hypothetical protein